MDGIARPDGSGDEGAGDGYSPDGRRSPIGAAVGNGGVETVRFLLDNSASPNPGMRSGELEERRRWPMAQASGWARTLPIDEMPRCMGHSAIDKDRLCRTAAVLLVERGAIVSGSEGMSDTLDERYGDYA